ncbi:hypothetical protein BY458DRAFT_519992 [Sporodiniella umbellata]|nr:hypothetical protein BY458DRAFT_519992 [Sporodiniella umbellata]
MNTTIFDLNLDTELIVIGYLDNRSLAHLSKTCRYFAVLVRRLLSFSIARVQLLGVSDSPSHMNFRAGATIGTTFYMPCIDETPCCYLFDLVRQVWSFQLLKLKVPIRPQTASVAAIGQTLYLVGGRRLQSESSSNRIIEIDIVSWNTQVATVSGTPPRPRYEHSVDVVANRYLVIFGGLCYNSVGENDIFVYDTLKKTWFIPPIQGLIPHLRFGHASAVIGNGLYIHGGAQLDSDSSYIVYDDLHRLNCETWTWCKYEHPEVEQYLRGQPRQRHPNLIPTTGDSPHDRFQSYMCASAGKLVVFGGRSIRMNSDDDILFHYPLGELSIFHTQRHAWTAVNAPVESDIFLSHLSVAVVTPPFRGIRVLVFGQAVPTTQQHLDGRYQMVMLQD